MNRLFIYIAALFIFISCSGRESKLTIATAANVQYAMRELTESFTNNTGVLCEIIIGSSGKLTAQIMEGAPFDIFLSADMDYPMYLYNNKLSDKKPEIYANGVLVLWTKNNEINPSIEELKLEKIKHIAIPNPDIAPYGAAALEVLKYYQIDDKYAYKLVYGESVSQTNQFIISGAAELGFTAKSVVTSPSIKQKGAWIELSQDLYTPIRQGVVIIKRKGKENINASKFYEFLFSSEAKLILEKHGYNVSYKK